MPKNLVQCVLTAMIYAFFEECLRSFSAYLREKYLRFGDVRKNTWLVVKNTSHVF